MFLHARTVDKNRRISLQTGLLGYYNYSYPTRRFWKADVYGGAPSGGRLSLLEPSRYRVGFEGVRKTYDGPLVMADDLTVINLTKDHIEAREVTFNHDSWPQGTSKEWDTAPRGEPATGLMTDWLKEGELKGLNPPPTQPID